MPKSIVSKAKIKKDIYETVKRAINCASDFNVKGKRVVVKPNVNSDDPVPGVANPAVTRAVVDYCFEKGAKSVIVGDRSSVFWPRTMANMKKVGLVDALKGSGAELIEFKRFRKVDVNGKHIKSIQVAQEVLDAEYLINVPVCHTHCLAVFSMALKNMMGAMKRSERLMFHAGSLQEKVAELNLAVKPDLNVLDATYVMYSGGPSEGPSKKRYTIFASEDRIAIDYTGLLEIQACGGLKGIDLWNLPQLKHARELGIGVKKKEDIIIKDC